MIPLSMRTVTFLNIGIMLGVLFGTIGSIMIYKCKRFDDKLKLKLSCMFLSSCIIIGGFFGSNTIKYVEYKIEIDDTKLIEIYFDDSDIIPYTYEVIDEGNNIYTVREFEK